MLQGGLLDDLQVAVANVINDVQVIAHAQNAMTDDIQELVTQNIRQVL